jgi:hypothetical protein
VAEEPAAPTEAGEMKPVTKRELEFANRRLFSVCLPDLVARELRAEADQFKLYDWCWLSSLLEMSFHDPWVLEAVSDCPGPLPVNLEVRLDHETIRRLRYFSKMVEISPTAYVQRLLYHLYATREICHSWQKTVESINLSKYRNLQL